MRSSHHKRYFFCGVGGSGMSPLALICKQKGYEVSGSDRSNDNGQSAVKFAALRAGGITLFPQDGSGVTKEIDALVVSSAVEESIPDVAAARAKNIPIIKRAELLAAMFNGFGCGISVAGTSGKSTVTGMIAHVLTALGKDPTVMNGAVIKNLGANMRVGAGDVFVTETDESDGSIALYNPAIAVVNNIALDHKSIEELQALFGDFIARAKKAVVLNYDDAHLRGLGTTGKVVSYAIAHEADLRAKDIVPRADGIEFSVNGHVVNLRVPGAHNVSNALACLAVCKAMDIDLARAVKALSAFEGIKRRMDVIGTKNNITVIDDFGHNPDKIAATLKTLKAFPGRLIVMFQMHGFGPLKLMGKEIIQSFADHLSHEDILFMPEVYYAGGTADRSVTAKDIIGIARAKNINATWFETRAEILPAILQAAKSGDRIVIMGARDDTLTDFASEILKHL